MAEVKAVRLSKAAGIYNVSSDHIMDALKGKGFSDLNPNTKLTPEMLDVLDKEFGSDKSIKQQADNTKLDKPAKEVVEMPDDVLTLTQQKKKEDEPEVLIKSSIVTKDEPETISAEKVQLEGTKVVGKVDLEEKPKKGKKKKEEPEAEVVEEVKTVAKKQEEVEEEIKHETQYQKLEGPKAVGKVDLTKFAEKPKKKEETAETKKDSGVKHERKRKLVKKKERAPLAGDPFYDKKVENFQRKRDAPFTKRPEPQAPEITEKQIEEKIRATMAKIQAQTSKSDRSKLRRGKREAIQEKLAAEQAGVQHGKLQVTEFISVSELASLMNITPVQVIQTCMQLGVIVSINQRLDATIIELVAAENGFEVEFISAADQTITPNCIQV